MFLALSVVAGHGDFFRAFFFIAPGTAVVSFFVLSGFYMALVISEKYGQDWKRFLMNRVIRLYPAYIFFTLLFGAFLYATGKLNTDPVALFLTFSLVGQDVLQALVSAGYWTRFATNDISHIVPIAQAWSVALELELYLVAAFAFRSAKGIALTLAAGVALRALLYLLGLTQHPLGISLLPNVIVFFSLGAVGYLVYRKIAAWPARARMAIAAALALLLIADCYAFDGFWGRYMQGPVYAFYFLIAALSPFLFSLSKESAIDKLVGDASYPVYLSHIMVFGWAAHFGFGKAFVLLATLAVSFLAVFLIDRPLSAFRLKRAGAAVVPARG